MRTARKTGAAVVLLLLGLVWSTAPGAAQDTFDAPAAPASRSEDALRRQFMAGDAATFADPEARSVTVTPDTDLVDGQVVDVHGTGFGGDILVGIVQCGKGLGLDGCDTRSVDIFEPDSASFTKAFSVDAIIHASSGDIDCRTFPAGCRLVVNNEYSLDGAAKADIAFDPDGPLEPLPTVGVVPDTDLLDGQTINVTGSGFHPNIGVTVFECPVDTDNPDGDCQNYGGGEADADGNLSAGYRLEATLQTFDFEEGFPGELVDCRDDPCELVAYSDDEFDHRASVALAFDPDGPLAPDMDLQVTPSTDLVDGQTVHATVEGYTWNGPVDVVQCSLFSATDGSLCDLDNAIHLTSDNVGNTETDYIVQDEFDGAAGHVDCFSDSCILVAVDRSVSISLGRGYLFVSLDFAGADGPDDPAGPADPTPLEPRFTG